MASVCLNLSTLPLLATLLAGIFPSVNSMTPLNCTKNINSCTAVLYHMNSGLSQQQIASNFSVHISQFSTISHKNRQDDLIKVPCSCQDVNGSTGYFYNTNYTVKPNDTFFNVSTYRYSGQALEVGGEEELFVIDQQVPIHLLCGCVETKSQIIVTYTVQQGDTLSDISTLLSARISDVEKMNPILKENPGFIDIGWVLFVPKEIKGHPLPSKELITGQRALTRDNQETNKMKSLITIMNKVFQADDPESALEDVIDENPRGNYPMKDVYKMAEIAE